MFVQEQVLMLPCPHCNAPVVLWARWAWVRVAGRLRWLPVEFRGICRERSAFVSEIEVEEPQVRITQLRPSPYAEIVEGAR